MSNISPYEANSISAFFTVGLARPGRLMLTNHVERLRLAAERTRAARPFQLDAWVVLPDHLHCVMTVPAGDDDFAGRWLEIRRRFCDSLNTTGPIWQRGVRGQVISGLTDYADCVRRCWFDPVRHGLVADPNDWFLSSLHDDELLERQAA
ncbi:transposase [Pseudooceanicola lipolyticus]|uniref:Transposase n=1 Tax=Pseudooceanicola lipolyticus TaxID=2029104 RepID=A0A2M8IVJ0_9RHOB|nr:transposase [Pseudooceanicola lipolyticus]PJE34542.1 transposase [Pseudooceanicola lipolyticus]